MRRLLCLALLSVPLWAVDPSTRMNQPTDEMENEAKDYADRMADAAEYQRLRSTAAPEAFDDGIALEALTRARRLLLTGHEIRARWAAEDGFDDAPYSRYAPDLVRLALEGAVVQANLPEVRSNLLILWLYFPDYPGMGEAMERALGACEDFQDFASAVHLEQDDPAQVIDLEGRTVFNSHESSRLLRFLALRGDRSGVAPRAALALARELLLTGDKDNLFEARRAYERFLEDYPVGDLTFTALCEYALSHLVAYRGKDYDIGTLVMAASLIDQAEIETRGDIERTRVVQAYRRRIRSWHQDRDLAVARWYTARGLPSLFAWLTMPAGLADWSPGARLFYRETIARDPTSRQGLLAERELASLPTAPALVPDEAAR
jgi:hypothetical protein